MKQGFKPERHWQQTQAQLIVGGGLVLVLVGGGLIWLLYGRAAAFVAVSCFLALGVIAGLLWLGLRILERWVRGDEP